MRKLLIAGLAVAPLTGIAYAQADRSGTAQQQEQVGRLQARFSGKTMTCIDATGATKQLEETTMRGSVEYQCVFTFGDGLKAQGASWIINPPKS